MFTCCLKQTTNYDVHHWQPLKPRALGDL